MTKLYKKVALLGMVLFLITIFNCCTTDAYAETTENVAIIWDYDNPPTDLAGFDLRINGNNETLIDISKDAREWSGTIAFQDGNNILDMRAKDQSGQVSMWSEPCYYDPIPNVSPSNVKVTVKITVIVQ